MKVLSRALLLLALVIRGGLALGVEEGVAFQVERYYSTPQSSVVDPPVRVGDILRFRWVGPQKPPATAVDVVPAGDGKRLVELGWEVYSQPKDDPTSAFSMIPLAPGTLELPALHVRDADRRILGSTQPLRFEVAPAASPEEMSKKAPDLLPPLGLPVPWTGLFVLILLGIGLAVVVVLVLRRLSRRRGAGVSLPGSASPAVPIAADEEALSRFREIEARRYCEQGRHKDHYFGVSETLKRYIERQFGFEAAESTTRELLRNLSSYGLAAGRLAELEALFEKLDRVKFTDFTPEAREGDEVVARARSWVEATRLWTRSLGHGGAS